jgi:aminoglycoside phosphotransferase (APT) family kinase protein
MPGPIGWDDDELEPMLIIDDLSEARWPPPWDSGLLDSVFEKITAMHSSSADLRRFSEAHGSHAGGWRTVAAASGPFLKLGLTSSDWLFRALPRLIEAEANCQTDGSAVTHFDLRSDNICISRSGAKFIDWAEACLGNPAVDLGFWLPSLSYEGGPLPEALLPNAPDVAAWVSGFFAARAGLPDIPDAPFVRRVQREHLATALPWVTRALKLGDL